MIAAAKEDSEDKLDLDSDDISENVVDELIGQERVEPEAPVPVEQIVIDEISALIERLSEVCKENHLPVVCSVLMPVLERGAVEIAEVQVLGYPLDDPKTLGILMSTAQGVPLVSAAHVLASTPYKAAEPTAGTDGAPAAPDASTAPAEPGEQG